VKLDMISTLVLDLIKSPRLRTSSSQLGIVSADQA
jgi:hypothetical protein